MALMKRLPVVPWYDRCGFSLCMYDFADNVQVSKTQYDRVWSYIEAGKQEGAKLILGGVKRSGRGFYADPTSKPL
jgi:hypothetical protein